MEVKETPTTNTNNINQSSNTPLNNQLPQLNNITVDDNGINIELNLNDFNLNKKQTIYDELFPSNKNIFKIIN